MSVSVHPKIMFKEMYSPKKYNWKESDSEMMEKSPMLHDRNAKFRSPRKTVEAPKLSAKDVDMTKKEIPTSIYGTFLHLRDFIVSVLSITRFTLRSVFTTGTMLPPFLRFVIAICTFIPRSLNVVCSILTSVSSIFGGNNKDEYFLKNMVNLIYNINVSPVNEMARLSRDFVAISTSFLQSLVQFYPKLVDFLAFLLQFMRLYCDCLTNLYHFVSNIYSLNYKFWSGCRNIVYRIKYVTFKVLKMFTW